LHERVSMLRLFVRCLSCSVYMTVVRPSQAIRRLRPNCHRGSRFSIPGMFLWYL
jgi:hypothetical protein